MGKLIVISDEFEKKLHPEARKVFHNWNADVQRQVQLNELNNDDLKFLSYYDTIKLKRIWEIPECLSRCTDIKDGDRLYDVYLGDIFSARGVISQLKRDLINIELDIIPPLRKICEGRIATAKEKERKRVEEEKRKEEEERQQAERAKEEQRRREEAAEAEQRQKEEEERWRAACKAVDPPIGEAKRYLDRLGEYDKFIEATLEAIEVYIEKGEDYLDDSRTFDYRWCLRKIDSRKEEEKRQIAASVAANEHNRELNKEKARLKELLRPKRKDYETYFKKQIGDRRHTGQSFAQLLCREEEQSFDETVVGISREKLDDIVSSDFRQFIDGEYWRSYFLLPSAEYSLEGVPCLDFMFDVFAIVEVRVWLKPGQKNFGDYVYDMPWREEKGCIVVSEDAEFLGYYYFSLNPEELGGYSFWQRIPLVVLKWLLSGGLLSGQAKHSGITVTAASDGMTTYRISKFKEEVNIPDDFADYLMSIGSIDEMANIGIVTEKVASVVRSELGELKVEQKDLSSAGKTIRKDSKKAKVFALLCQGRRPSDPEVQALGLKTETTYRYHQEWKKTYSSSHNSV